MTTDRPETPQAEARSSESVVDANTAAANVRDLPTRVRVSVHATRVCGQSGQLRSGLRIALSGEACVNRVLAAGGRVTVRGGYPDESNKGTPGRLVLTVSRSGTYKPQVHLEQVRNPTAYVTTHPGVVRLHKEVPLRSYMVDTTPVGGAWEIVPDPVRPGHFLHRLALMLPSPVHFQRAAREFYPKKRSPTSAQKRQAILALGEPGVDLSARERQPRPVDDAASLDLAKIEERGLSWCASSPTGRLVSNRSQPDVIDAVRVVRAAIDRGDVGTQVDPVTGRVTFLVLTTI